KIPDSKSNLKNDDLEIVQQEEEKIPDFQTVFKTLQFSSFNMIDGVLSQKEMILFNEAESLIRSGNNVKALGNLKVIKDNLQGKPDSAKSAVNFLIARAYYNEARYTLSLENSHRAIKFCSDWSGLKVRALFLAGINYEKLDQIEKTRIIFKKIIGSANVSEVLGKYVKFRLEEIEAKLGIIDEGNNGEKSIKDNKKIKKAENKKNKKVKE
ncbi:MAG: hypothetical protein ABII27_07320, partial [bacterium]